MIVRRVTRIANPRRKAAARTRPRKANARKRLSAKQIKFFGTKSQRAALKRRRVKVNPKRRRRVAKAAPRRRIVRVSAAPRRKHRKSNPAHMLTLGLAGLVNPRPRKKRRNTKVAATRKRRRNPAAKTAPRRRRRVARNPRRPHPRRRNTTVVVRTRRRRRSANPRRRVRRMNPRRRSTGRRRNPSLFGHGGGMEMGKMVVGGLAGVTICKAVPNMLPASLTSSPIMRTVTSVAIAVASGFLASKFIGDKTVADAIMFGGLMQAGSVALNSFLPSVGATIGLQGLGGGIGDLIAGSYPIPQNPIFPQYNPGYGALPAPAMPAGKAMAPSLSGLAGPFGSAF